VISEKLDGISCLYIQNLGKVSMYLRGDGVKGVDVSGLAKHIELKTFNVSCMVRGEIVLKKSDTPAGSIGRSLINGWVHRLSSAPSELAKVRFVAYELIEPVMSRKEQFAWMKQYFEIPWVRVVNSVGLKEEFVKEKLLNRRTESDYSTDGIVIGADTIPVSTVGVKEARNPKDAVAFKASLDEQKAETTITSIEWNLSRQGFLIPTLLIEGVVIGEAKIQRLSGHNASMVYKNKLGPGARIIVRRSGDVIPTLDTVITATSPSMPSGTWTWDENQTHAVATVVEGGTKESNARALLHALQTLEIDGVGPGLVEKLVSANPSLDTLKKLLDASVASLSSAVGPGRGPKLAENLRASLEKASHMKMMIASNLLPRGVGERKLELLFALEADPTKWTFEKFTNVNGWGSLGIQELLKSIPTVLEWCAQFSKAKPLAQPLAKHEAKPQSNGKTVVFSGVRDKVLEDNLVTKGWTIGDTLTKKTDVLVVADVSKETGKTKKAKEYGIRILSITDFSANI
jgi:DNA ligase (NAD+)